MMRCDFPTLRHGLVAAYCPSLGDSGYTLIDRSGRGQHAKLVNMEGQNVWQSSTGGTSLSLDGTNDYAAAPASFIGSQVSISAWAYFRTTPTNYPSIIQLRRSTAANSTHCVYMLHRPNGDTWPGGKSGSRITFACNVATASTAVVQAPLVIGKFVHYCGTYDGRRSSMYADGVLHTTFDVAMTLSSGMDQLAIGNNPANTADGYVNGFIDDVRVYNRALSYAEVRLLAQRRGVGLTPRIVTYKSIRQALAKRFLVNDGGTWKDAEAYVNAGGVWKPAEPFAQDGGTWK